jgi:hypothetical protein
MSIESEEGVLFQVRVRFTDGNGNYSARYTTAEITVDDSGYYIQSEDLNYMLSSEDGNFLVLF